MDYLSRFFSSITDLYLRRLLKFVVKRAIGDYLDDELVIDQLEVSSRDGIISLNSLSLNCARINSEHLKGQPIRLESATIQTLESKISYLSALSDGFSMEAIGVHVVVEPCDTLMEHSFDRKSELQSPIFHDNETSGPVITDPSSDDHAIIANWVETLFASLKLTVKGLTIIVRSHSNGPDISVSANTSSLSLNIETLIFYNTHPGLLKDDTTESMVSKMMSADVSPSQLGSNKFMEIDGFTVCLKLAPSYGPKDESRTCEYATDIREIPIVASKRKTTLLISERLHLKVVNRSFDLTVPLLDIHLSPLSVSQLMLLAGCFSPSAHMAETKNCASQDVASHPSDMFAAIPDPSLRTFLWLEQSAHRGSRTGSDDGTSSTPIDYNRILDLTKQYYDTKRALEKKYKEGAALSPAVSAPPPIVTAGLFQVRESVSAHERMSAVAAALDDESTPIIDEELPDFDDVCDGEDDFIGHEDDDDDEDHDDDESMFQDCHTGKSVIRVKMGEKRSRGGGGSSTMSKSFMGESSMMNQSLFGKSAATLGSAMFYSARDLDANIDIGAEKAGGSSDSVMPKIDVRVRFCEVQVCFASEEPSDRPRDGHKDGDGDGSHDLRSLLSRHDHRPQSPALRLELGLSAENLIVGARIGFSVDGAIEATCSISNIKIVERSTIDSAPAPPPPPRRPQATASDAGSGRGDNQMLFTHSSFDSSDIDPDDSHLRLSLLLPPPSGHEETATVESAPPHTNERVLVSFTPNVHARNIIAAPDIEATIKIPGPAKQQEPTRESRPMGAGDWSSGLSGPALFSTTGESSSSSSSSGGGVAVEVSLQPIVVSIHRASCEYWAAILRSGTKAYVADDTESSITIHATIPAVDVVVHTDASRTCAEWDELIDALNFKAEQRSPRAGLYGGSRLGGSSDAAASRWKIMKHPHRRLAGSSAAEAALILLRHCQQSRGGLRMTLKNVRFHNQGLNLGNEVDRGDENDFTGQIPSDETTNMRERNGSDGHVKERVNQMLSMDKFSVRVFVADKDEAAAMGMEETQEGRATAPPNRSPAYYQATALVADGDRQQASGVLIGMFVAASAGDRSARPDRSYAGSEACVSLIPAFADGVNVVSVRAHQLTVDLFQREYNALLAIVAKLSPTASSAAAPRLAAVVTSSVPFSSYPTPPPTPTPFPYYANEGNAAEQEAAAATAAAAGVDGGSCSEYTQSSSGSHDLPTGSRETESISHQSSDVGIMFTATSTILRLTSSDAYTSSLALRGDDTGRDGNPTVLSTEPSYSHRQSELFGIPEVVERDPYHVRLTAANITIEACIGANRTFLGARMGDIAVYEMTLSQALVVDMSTESPRSRGSSPRSDSESSTASSSPRDAKWKGPGDTLDSRDSVSTALPLTAADRFRQRQAAARSSSDAATAAASRSSSGGSGGGIGGGEQLHGRRYRHLSRESSDEPSDSRSSMQSSSAGAGAEFCVPFLHKTTFKSPPAEQGYESCGDEEDWDFCSNSQSSVSCGSTQFDSQCDVSPQAALVVQMTLENDQATPGANSIQRLKFRIDFEDMTLRYYPASAWLKEVLKLLTPVSPAEALSRRAALQAKAERRRLRRWNATNSSQPAASGDAFSGSGEGKGEAEGKGSNIRIHRNGIGVGGDGGVKSAGSYHGSASGKSEARRSGKDADTQPTPQALLSAIPFATTSICVNFHNTTVDYSCAAAGSRTIISFGDISLNTTIVSTSSVFALAFTMTDLSVHLSNRILHNPRLEQRPLSLLPIPTRHTERNTPRQRLSANRRSESSSSSLPCTSSTLDNSILADSFLHVSHQSQDAYRLHAWVGDMESFLDAHAFVQDLVRVKRVDAKLILNTRYSRRKKLYFVGSSGSTRGRTPYSTFYRMGVRVGEGGGNVVGLEDVEDEATAGKAALGIKADIGQIQIDACVDALDVLTSTATACSKEFSAASAQDDDSSDDEDEGVDCIDGMRAKRSAAAVDGSAVVSSSSATAPSPPEDPSPRRAHIASTRYTNFAHPPASLPPPSWMDSIAEDSFAPQPHRSKEVNVGHSIAGQSRIKKNGGKVGEGGGVWFGTGDASQLQAGMQTMQLQIIDDYHKSPRPTTPEPDSPEFIARWTNDDDDDASGDGGLQDPYDGWGGASFSGRGGTGGGAGGRGASSSLRGCAHPRGDTDGQHHDDGGYSYDYGDEYYEVDGGDMGLYLQRETELRSVHDSESDMGLSDLGSRVKYSEDWDFGDEDGEDGKKPLGYSLGGSIFAFGTLSRSVLRKAPSEMELNDMGVRGIIAEMGSDDGLLWDEEDNADNHSRSSGTSSSDDGQQGEAEGEAGAVKRRVKMKSNMASSAQSVRMNSSVVSIFDMNMIEEDDKPFPGTEVDGETHERGAGLCEGMDADKFNLSGGLLTSSHNISLTASNDSMFHALPDYGDDELDGTAGFDDGGTAQPEEETRDRVLIERNHTIDSLINGDTGGDTGGGGGGGSGFDDGVSSALSSEIASGMSASMSLGGLDKARVRVRSWSEDGLDIITRSQLDSRASAATRGGLNGLHTSLMDDDAERAWSSDFPSHAVRATSSQRLDGGEAARSGGRITEESDMVYEPVDLDSVRGGGEEEESRDILTELHGVNHAVMQSSRDAVMTNNAPNYPLQHQQQQQQQEQQQQQQQQPTLRDTTQRARWYLNLEDVEIFPQYFPLIAKLRDFDDNLPSAEAGLVPSTIVHVQATLTLRIYAGSDWQYVVPTCEWPHPGQAASHDPRAAASKSGEQSQSQSQSQSRPFTAAQRRKQLLESLVGENDDGTNFMKTKRRAGTRQKGQKHVSFGPSAPGNDKKTATGPALPASKETQEEQEAEDSLLSSRVSSSFLQLSAKGVSLKARLYKHSNGPDGDDSAVLPDQRVSVSAQDILLSYKNHLMTQRRKVVGLLKSYQRARSVGQPMVGVVMLGYSSAPQSTPRDRSTVPYSVLQSAGDSAEGGEGDLVAATENRQDANGPGVKEGGGQGGDIADGKTGDGCNDSDVIGDGDGSERVASSAGTEYRITVSIIPLRCFLDEPFLALLKHLAEQQSLVEKCKPSYNATDRTGDRAGKGNIDDGAPELEGEGAGTGTGAAAPLYIQHLAISDIDVKIDYQASTINFQALQQGDYLQYLNLAPLDGLEVTLKSVSFFGVSGFPRAIDLTTKAWVEDIYKNQLFRVIGGAAVFKGVAHITQDIGKLLQAPFSRGSRQGMPGEYGAMRQGAAVGGGGGHVFVELKKATSRLWNTVVYEGADAAYKLSALVARELAPWRDPSVVALHAAGDSGTRRDAYRHQQLIPHQQRQLQPHTAVTSSSPRRQHRVQRVPTGNRGSDDVIGASTAQAAVQPGGVKEGLQRASQSISREAANAVHTVVTDPARRYSQGETQGADYLSTVARIFPSALAGLAMGVAEAVSNASLGLRNHVNPDARRDDEDVFQVDQSVVFDRPPNGMSSRKKGRRKPHSPREKRS